MSRQLETYRCTDCGVLVMLDRQPYDRPCSILRGEPHGVNVLSCDGKYVRVQVKS